MEQWTISIPEEPETHCAGCGTELATVGPPINDVYCPNDQCGRERQEMVKALARQREAHERAEYERLKAKYGE